MSWWKADDYALVKYGTAIAPIGDVTAYTEVPQDIDWTPFLSWSATKDNAPKRRPEDKAPTLRRAVWWRPTLQPPSAGVAEQMRQWCQQYGCPGTLLLWAERLVDPAVPPRPRTPSATQVRHDRVGHLWQRHAYSVPSADADEAGAYLAERFHYVEFLPPDFTQGREVTRLAPTAVAACFGNRLTRFPSPGSADFWQRYREPTVELLRASHYLRDVAAAAPSDKSVHHAAMAELKAGVALSGSHWQVASLLHAYSLHREPQQAQCPQCEKLFTPQKSKQIFCKRLCENTFNRKFQKRSPRG